MKRRVSILLVAMLLLTLALSPYAMAESEAVNEAAEEVYAKYGLPRTGMEFDEPITITRFVDASEVQVDKDNPFNKAMEAITNIKIEVEYLVGDPYEKFGVMIAGGDLPDTINVGVGEHPQFIEAGVYMPLQDLVEEFAPNYREQFDQYWPYMFKPDGNKYIMSIWGMPTGDPNPITYNGCAFYIQKAVLDHFGRAPETLDEYFDFIREYKELNPTIDGVPTIGFEAQMNDWRVWSLLHPSKFLQGYGNWGDFGVADVETNTLIDPYSEDYYRIYPEKLNDEFLKGTILAETFTRDHDGYLATIASGAVLGIFDQEWNFQNAQDVLKQEGRYERTYIPLGLTFDSSITPAYIDADNFEPHNGFGITVDSPHAERIMKLVNYIMQEDVQRWLSWGAEGEHYYVENGRMMRTEEQRLAQQDPQWVRDNMGRWYRDLWPKIDGTFSDGNATSPDRQNEEAWENLTEYDKELFSKLGIESRIDYLGDAWSVPAYYPFWAKRSFAGDGSAADLGWERQREYLVNNLPKLIVTPAGEFDAAYAEFQSGLSKIDISATMTQLQQDIDDILAIADK